jgi:hypothetical protein
MAHQVTSENKPVQGSLTGGISQRVHLHLHGRWFMVQMEKQPVRAGLPDLFTGLPRLHGQVVQMARKNLTKKQARKIRPSSWDKKLVSLRKQFAHRDVN